MKSYAALLVSGPYVYTSQKLRWRKIRRLTKAAAIVSNCVLFKERVSCIDKAKARFLASSWVTNDICFSTIYISSIALEWKNSWNRRPPTGGLSFSVLLSTVRFSNG